MKKLLFVGGFLLTLLLFSCNSVKTLKIVKSEISLTENIDSTNIAILPFKMSGASLPKYTGKLFADKLNNKLLFNKRLFIVEKLKVSEVLETLGIDNSEDIKFSDIKEIGLKLDAEYLIVGEVLKYPNAEFVSKKSKYNLNVTLRILSAKSGKIIGFANVTSLYRQYNIVDVINSIVKEIAEDLD